MSILLTHLTTEIRRRWRAVRDTGDAGYTTETVLVTALLVALALAAIAAISAIIVAKANALELG
ncbi:MAG: hypothetical protein JXA67_13060 [Micromonosporaceae bacterium]|nr:hypothetical protein [Micromonosporaceae bacterium]